MSRPVTSRPGSKSRPVLCAAYLRCSSDDQKEGDFSTINNQRDLAKQYIDRRIAEIIAKGGRAEFVGFYDD